MPRAGLNREAVIEAAAALADGEGLQELTLACLASRLGVRSPSLYAHVRGLEDLRAAIAVRGARGLAEAMGRAAVGRSGEEALQAAARAYRDYARLHPGCYAAAQLVGELLDDEEALAAATAATEVALAIVRGYGLEGEEAIHAARTVRVALHGFVSLEAEGGFGIDLPLERTFDRIIQALQRGLAGWPAAGLP